MTSARSASSFAGGGGGEEAVPGAGGAHQEDGGDNFIGNPYGGKGPTLVMLTQDPSRTRPRTKGSVPNKSGLNPH